MAGIIHLPNRRIERPFKEVKRNAILVIYRSLTGENGEADWEVVPPDQVPEWVTSVDHVRAMVFGQMIQNEAVDPYWYRAVEQVQH